MTTNKTEENEALKELEILTGEPEELFAELSAAQKEFDEKDANLKKEHEKIISFAVLKFMDLIDDKDIKAIFLKMPGGKETLIHELVRLALNFSKEPQKARLCHTPYLLVGNGDPNEARKFASKMNEIRDEVHSLADFNCHWQVGGICFQLEFRKKVNVPA
jgi:hypothetical protein